MQQVRHALVYLLAVSATALSFSTLFLLLSEMSDGFVALRAGKPMYLIADWTSLFCACWVMAFVWALIPWFVVNLYESPPSKRLSFHLSLALVFSAMASVFHTVFAPEAKPNQTLLDAISNEGFAVFAVSVVTSSLFGALLYWLIAGRSDTHFRHLSWALFE